MVIFSNETSNSAAMHFYDRLTRDCSQKLIRPKNKSYPRLFQWWKNNSFPMFESLAFCIMGFITILETTQAMLWFSSKSIIQKNGNIGIFQRALKLWEITASFISLHWKHRITPIHFWLLPLHGAMNHSGTPLWLMLRSPSFYQGANCQVWSSSFDDTWRQRPN